MHPQAAEPDCCRRARHYLHRFRRRPCLHFLQRVCVARHKMGRRGPRCSVDPPRVCVPRACAPAHGPPASESRHSTALQVTPTPAQRWPPLAPANAPRARAQSRAQPLRRARAQAGGSAARGGAGAGGAPRGPCRQHSAGKALLVRQADCPRLPNRPVEQTAPLMTDGRIAIICSRPAAYGEAPARTRARTPGLWSFSRRLCLAHLAASESACLRPSESAHIKSLLLLGRPTLILYMSGLIPTNPTSHRHRTFWRPAWAAEA